MSRRMSELGHTKKIRATAIIFGFFPKLASALLGLTAISYVTGYIELSEYFHGLGCEWIMGTLNASQIMMGGGHTFFVLSLIIAPIFILPYLNKPIIGSVLLISGGVIFLAIFSMDAIGEHIAGRDVSLAITLFRGANILGCLAIGSFIGYIFGVLVDGGSFNLFKIGLIILYVLMTFVFVSKCAGSARYLSDSSAKLSKLPVVELVAGSGDWRLVTVAGSSILVFTLNDKKEDRVFRLISMNEVRVIHAPRYLPGPG